MILLLLSILQLGFIHTQTKPPVFKETSCHVRALLFDPDTTGTNVRETPRGKIIDRLYAPRTEDLVGREPIQVLIVGAKDGWLKIETGNNQFGWVFGTLLGTHTTWNRDNTTPLYAEPNANSRVTTVLREFEMRAYIIHCTGQWAYVEVRPKKGPAIRGWLAPQNQCAEPYTTCG